MARTIRIKVPREALIERVKEVRDAEVAEWEKKVAQYEADLATYPSRLADFYERIAASIRETGEMPDVEREYYRNGKAHTVLVEEPEAPYLRDYDKPKTERHDRVIRQLEMAVDDLITVNTSDYNEYL